MRMADSLAAVRNIRKPWHINILRKMNRRDDEGRKNQTLKGSPILSFLWSEDEPDEHLIMVTNMEKCAAFYYPFSLLPTCLSILGNHQWDDLGREIRINTIRSSRERKARNQRPSDQNLHRWYANDSCDPLIFSQNLYLHFYCIILISKEWSESIPEKLKVCCNPRPWFIQPSRRK
jgi:hypothetical protein